MARVLTILCATTVLAASAQAQLTVTNGLTAWFKADAGVTTNASGRVLSWADQSVNGNNATPYNGAAYSPTYVSSGLNGLPVLSFDGSHFYGDNLTLANPLDLSSGASVFVVALNANRKNYNGLVHLGNTADPFSLAVPGGKDDLAIYWQVGSSGGGAPVSGNPLYAVNSADSYLFGNDSGPATNNPYLYSVVAAAGGATQRVNQVDVTLATVGSYFLPTNTASIASIGVGYGYYSSGLEGYIAEVLIYNTTLSDTERLYVEAYLDGKYSLGIPEPSTLALLCMGVVMFWRVRCNFN